MTVRQINGRPQVSCTAELIDALKASNLDDRADRISERLDERLSHLGLTLWDVRAIVEMVELEHDALAASVDIVPSQSVIDAKLEEMAKAGALSPSNAEITQAARISERQRILELQAMHEPGFEESLSAAINDGTLPTEYALQLFAEIRERGVTLSGMRAGSPAVIPFAAVGENKTPPGHTWDKFTKPKA
ncbi:MAG: hypothetical protein R3F15_00745 [Lysobacterales bacterium]